MAIQSLFSFINVLTKGRFAFRVFRRGAQIGSDAVRHTHFSRHRSTFQNAACTPRVIWLDDGTARVFWREMLIAPNERPQVKRSERSSDLLQRRFSSHRNSHQLLKHTNLKHHLDNTLCCVITSYKNQSFLHELSWHEVTHVFPLAQDLCELASGLSLEQDSFCYRWSGSRAVRFLPDRTSRSFLMKGWTPKCAALHVGEDTSDSSSLQWYPSLYAQIILYLTCCSMIYTHHKQTPVS